MRQLRSRKQQCSSSQTASGLGLAEAEISASTGSRENKELQKSVLDEQQIAETNETAGKSSQKRKNRKKKKHANARKCEIREDGCLETCNVASPAETNVEEPLKENDEVVLPVNLNQVVDPQDIKVSEETPDDSNGKAIANQKASEQFSLSKQRLNTSDAFEKILEVQKTPGTESPKLSNAKESIDPTVHPVVWSNPAFCSETVSEQKSFNTGSTCSPGCRSSLSCCSKLICMNVSEPNVFSSYCEVRVEESFLEKSIEQKVKSRICTDDFEVKSCSISATREAALPVLSRNATSQESGDDRGASVQNSLIKQNTIQFHGLQKSLFDASENETSSIPAFHGSSRTTDFPDVNELLNVPDNQSRGGQNEPFSLSESLQEDSLQHSIQKKKIITKTVTSQEDELEQGLEEDIRKEIEILNKRLADIHARREARKASQEIGKEVMSCPGTPVLVAKLLPHQDAPAKAEQNMNVVGDKSRNCKGRVVSAKFLECHSKPQGGKTPTSVDRKFNAHANFVPGSARIKPQRRGVSLGGFGILAKTDYADSHVRSSDNSNMHFSHISERKELIADRITPAKRMVVVEGLASESKVQVKTSDQEKNQQGINRKGTTDTKSAHDTGLIAGKSCTRDILRFDVSNSNGKFLPPSTEQQVIENNQLCKKSTPEFRRSRVFPKSIAKSQFQTDDFKGTEKLASELADAQMLATLRESRASRKSPVIRRQLEPDDIKGIEKVATEFPEAQLLAALRENRAFRKSPLTGKAKTVPSRYSESPKQSTPPSRLRTSDPAEKASLPSDTKRYCSDKKSEKHPSANMSPGKPTSLFSRTYVSPFKVETMPFKKTGKGTQKAQKSQDKRGSMDAWKKSSIDNSHHSLHQDENENIPTKAGSLAEQTHSIH